MTKRERVIAAMNNQPVDRPPVGFWFHFKPEQAKGQPCVQAHLDYYNRIDTDIAKLMCDGYFDYPAKAINWACFVENMNLTEGKAFFGGKCVLGGFDNRAQSLIVNGTREEIEEYTRTLVEKAGKTGVMIGADCTLPGTIDVERIGWVVDAAKAL